LKVALDTPGRKYPPGRVKSTATRPDNPYLKAALGVDYYTRHDPERARRNA
jgi:hypothetical protein